MTDDSDEDDEPPVFDSTSIAVDSGASDNFGDITTHGTARRPTENRIVMAGATGDCKTSIARDTFDLPLPAESLDFHVFEQGDVQRPLLSVGKVCDAGCSVFFTQGHCYFLKDRRVLLKGGRDPRTGLYLLPRFPRTPKVQYGFNLSQPYHHRAYDGYTIPKLMSYLHGCAGFPTTSTWIKAIRHGYFMGWPGLTASRVNRYLPPSEETALGHLKLNRQGTRSTSKGVSREVGQRRKVMVCHMPTTELTGTIGTDQTGRFPVTSDRNHKYIFIMFDEDINYIHAVPIKSRKGTELTRAFKESYDELAECGFRPILHRLDNETSRELMAAIKAKQLVYETVPPANHRRNPAERAIQTFKSHFISTLNGVDKDFPAGAWDLLIPQTNLTLNLLRPCTVNDAHSAYSYVYGPYDFNAHPLAPLGCRAIVHQRAIGSGGSRCSFDDRGKVGYYIGPVKDSYRVWEFYMPDTRATQKTDTAEFFPKTPLPTTTAETEILEALDRIEVAVNEPRPPRTELMKTEGPVGAIHRLREMYRKPNSPVPATPARVKGTDTPPRVSEGREYAGINRYGKKPQKYKIGTRVRVVEKQDGKRVVFIGEATGYDARTGTYHVAFEDGEWDDFDEDEMTHYRLVKTKAPARPTTYANQLTVAGYFPKAGPAPQRQFGLLGETYGYLYGLNAGSIWDEELHKWMAYRDLMKHPNPKIRRRWEQAGMNEFARLAQGHGGVEGMDVITFIARHEVPAGRRATYARYVVDYRPEKDEPWRLRITCGGDKLDYLGNTTTHSASMETIKCQLNSIVSTLNACAATGDISNMYLGSDLPEAEYVRFRLSLIPEAFIEAYGLRALATPNGFIYARVNKAWYGLKQAGKIAHDDLVQRLSEGGYKKAPLVEGYFYHVTRPISFTLVVDDFLIKYIDKSDLEHLQATVGKHYKFKVDEDAKQYVGIHLKWDYSKRSVRLSMDGYVKQALSEFEYTAACKPHYAPSQYNPPQYGSKVQFAKVDETAPLPKDKITFIQRVVGKLLYYARAVDPTMLHAINDISLSAAKGTEATLDATMYLLNYAHTNPDTEVIYRASDMILRVDSDAAYLVAPEARSRAGGYQYLSNKEGTLFNGPVLVVAKVIKNVMASAAEAEIAALFINAQEAAGLRNCLRAMGFPQPATPLKTDNTTACGILNNTMKQKRSKAIDVRFYWLRDRAQQGQFYIYWDSGKHNLADFHTKKHSPAFHKSHRAVQSYIEGLSPETLQGCIEMMNSDGESMDDGQTEGKAPTLLALQPHLMHKMCG